MLLRGTAHTEMVEGVAREYAAAAERYFGEAQGRAWVNTVRQLSPYMVRVVVRPNWVRILDFEQRFPSALASAMAGQ